MNPFGSGARRSGSGMMRRGGNRLILIIVLLLALFLLKSLFGGTSDSGNGTGTDGTASGSGLFGGDDATGDGISGNDSGSSGTASGGSGSAGSSGGSGSAGSLSGGDPTLDNTVSSAARAKHTQILDDGSDLFTLMIYMCGTDLESRSGMGTADLNEILHARFGDNVRVIIETGGTSAWKNSVIDSSTNQRWQATDKGLVLLQDNLGDLDMTDPDTLSGFIRYCEANYKANRYGLVLWDHGGGSVSGYGYDQRHPGSSMNLGKIRAALEAGDCTFDFIGFDACLMATLETALMAEPYADYLIASEETEPGTGWYYTDWLTTLGSDAGTPTTELGRQIIDDFIRVSAQNAPKDKTTLSLVDLAELKGTVPDSFRSFASSTAKLLDSDAFRTVSDARANAREFAPSSSIDQVDLIHMAELMGTAEAQSLNEALRGCVKYNRTSSAITHANGLSIYFPYGKLSHLDGMLDTYEEIGLDAAYSDCIRSFANLEAGGQIVAAGSSSAFGSPLDMLAGLTGYSGPGGTGSAGSSGNAGGDGAVGSGDGMASTLSGLGADVVTDLLGAFLQGGDFSGVLDSIGGEMPGSVGSAISGKAPGWLDADRITNAAGYYSENSLDPTRLKLTEKGDGQVLSLTDEEWDLVQNVELNVFLDDGSGYIDLGLDNVYAFDDDGDLLADFDGTWLAIDGQVVSYRFLSEEEHADGSTTITGAVPVLLNGQLADLILVFDRENPDGMVAGARIRYSGETGTVAKGLDLLMDGDQIDFLCDYYTYDEEFENSYMLGEQLIVDGTPVIRNISVGDDRCLASWRLTDIYGNTCWAPAVVK